MKKFISFVMAAAMVASLVPATAFAADNVTATAKIVDALDLTKQQAVDKPTINETNYPNEVPELRLNITGADYRRTEINNATMDVTLTLDNAEFLTQNINSLKQLVSVYKEDGRLVTGITPGADDGATESFASDSNAGTGADLVDVLGPSSWELIASKDEARFNALDDEDALEWLFGKGATIVNPTDNVAADLKLEKAGANPASVTVVANGTQALVSGVTPKMVVDYLVDGYTFSDTTDADKVFVVAGATMATANNGKTLGTQLGDLTVTNQEVFNQFCSEQKAANNTYDQGTYTAGSPDSTQASGVEVSIDPKKVDSDEVTFTFTGFFERDWYIIFDLASKLDKTGEGRTATVSVSSDMVSADDLVYVTVGARGITASTRKTATLAEEEKITTETDIKIKSTVGKFANGQVFELKLSKGFEFAKDPEDGSNYRFDNRDGNVVYMEYTGATDTEDEIIIDKDAIEIEADSAKSGSTCTLTVKALKDRDIDDQSANVPGSFSATATVEIAKVVDYKVELSVDEDEDVPVIYSGVNVDNYGITDDSDHMSLEVTAKETFPGAWSMRKGFNFELPEHVYVTDVDVRDTDNFYINRNDVETADVKAAFWNAYQEGSHVNFEFEKRVFDDVDNDLRDKECAEMTFQLELVADPGFEGDVVLKLTGELVDDQEVTIAKFVKPYEVKAEQNDIIIDYRYTDIPTAITITEAEAGLWEKNNATFYFNLERGTSGNFMEFEDDPTFEIDSNSDLEIKNDKANGGRIEFTVKTESDEAATVTIKDMQLFMNRSIPAGPYDLEIDSTLEQAYDREILWAPDQLGAATVAKNAQGNSTLPGGSVSAWALGADRPSTNTVKEDSFVDDVADYSNTVKEAFVNVVTAGRDVDDASFTTKVVVPVGESYMVAGEKQIELDVPAYINAAGYTMLPIRAVATALGISNNNVLWDQPTKTVTILYGQRIITMTQGQKVVYVNGSAIPASAAVENTNSRTFLPMRDLATALGVTDITWDQATRTATLNGNQK